MSSSRKLIAEFFGVFLIGALAGGLIFWLYSDTQLTTFMSRTTNPDGLTERINKKYADVYHLTPDELQRIQPMIKEMAQQLYKERHQFGVDIMDTLDTYHAKIAAQLAPEHRAAYEAAMAERHKTYTTLLLPDQSSPGTDTK